MLFDHFSAVWLNPPLRLRPSRDQRYLRPAATLLLSLYVPSFFTYIFLSFPPLDRVCSNCRKLPFSLLFLFSEFPLWSVTFLRIKYFKQLNLMTWSTNHNHLSFCWKSTSETRHLLKKNAIWKNRNDPFIRSSSPLSSSRIDCTDSLDSIRPYWLSLLVGPPEGILCSQRAGMCKLLVVY